jgi:hypothetical protein
MSQLVVGWMLGYQIFVKTFRRFLHFFGEKWRFSKKHVTIAFSSESGNKLFFIDIFYINKKSKGDVKSLVQSKLLYILYTLNPAKMDP